MFLQRDQVFDITADAMDYRSLNIRVVLRKNCNHQQVLISF